MDRKWWTLAGACSGLFLLMLDSTVVALALPEIRGDVGASGEGLQWVMNGYLLTIAVLVVTAGRLGDMFGRKRVFLVGMGVFAAGSVVSGAAGDEVTLIVGRVLQGAGAAPMLSLSLALVCNVFPTVEQPRALGIWAAVSAVALAIGPLAGGLLIELDWRVIFWMNLPVAAVGVAITAFAAPESTDPEAGTRVDWAGLVALSVGVTAVVLALVQSRQWSATTTLALAVVGLVALAGFWWTEHRVRDPIVDFGLFRNRPYFGASAAAFALVGAYWAVMFFQPQYLQDVRGHSPIASGLLVLPITAPMIFVSPFSGRLIGRFGARRLMTAGMVFGLGGLLLLTQVGAETSFAVVLLAYLLFGIALGLVYAPMSTAAMAAMPGEKVGIASGVLAMDRVLAGAVALAATGAVFHALLGDGDSFAAAIAGSTWVPAALCAVGVGLTWTFVRDPSPPAPGAVAAEDPGSAALQHHQHHRRFHL
ncbi:MAG TPA: DHA2 family efflux MFS transporter permease subunit [Solirubrobacterales bacterium]|nr:DHA2 family efflux MFS transporter permease subunit [Solirubrobacterales bacterium]